MIRERKNEKVPSSLLTTSRYDGEDVKAQLLEDQHEKCYICERKLGTDFEIEHFKSKEKYHTLRQEWTNLFMSCRYCNRKKSSLFDDNLYPLDVNIEDEIEQRIDFNQNKALFTTAIADAPHENTVRMLHLFYNGKRKMRVIKEEHFFDEAKQKMIRFSRMVNDYLMNPTPTARSLISAELSIGQEMLGFKYWIIRDNHLENDFKDEIMWNKH